VLSIVRLVKITELQTFSLVMITIYFVLFGLFLLAVEFGLKRIKVSFYFLNFCWGKALFDFFIGCMAVSSALGSWVEIPIAIVFFLATLFLLIIGVCYRKEESARVEKALAELNGGGAENKPKEDIDDQ
jgi:hypothetical protein